MRKGLDTNVIVYAFDNSDPEKHETAVKIVKNLLAHPENYAIATQALAEAEYVIKRKYPAAEETYVRFVELLRLLIPLRIVPYTVETIIPAAKHRNFWDALLAYAYVQSGIETLLTENVSDFEDLPIKTENPFTQ